MKRGIIAVLTLFLVVTALVACNSKPYEEKKTAPPDASAPKE